MSLSSTAQQYLSGLQRDLAFAYLDREAIIAHFRQYEIPIFDPVIDFYINYSGLRLTITRKPSESFFADLDLPTAVSENFITIKTRYYFFFAEAHATAQFWFVLGDRGELGTYDNNTDTVSIHYSSFGIFVESYARKDLMHRAYAYELAPYFSLRDPTAFDTFFAEYRRDPFINDSFNQWLSHDGITVEKGVWLGENTFYVHLYGDKREACEALAGQLKELKIIG